MPNFGMTRQQRQAAKWARLFKQSAQPCLFTPDDGSTPYQRQMCFPPVDMTSDNNEYLPRMQVLSEFLMADGAVNVADQFTPGQLDENGSFVAGSKAWRITQQVASDEITTVWVCVEI